MTWRVGSSVLSLVAAGAIGLAIAGDPPPPTGDIHLAPGTGESGQLAFTSVFRESTGGYAPQLVLLEASATGTGITASASAYSPQAGDIEWYWTFSKDGDAAWADELYSAPVNLIDEFCRKGGPVYGQRLPMVFDEPGTYYATCTAVMPDGTRATSAVRTITVLDPDVEFTAAETYVVSTSSTWTGAPSHNVGNRYTSLGAAAGAARTSGATKVRILARRGETFAGTSMGNTSTLQWMFGAYGTGADPIVTSNMRFANFGAATGRNIRVTNWDFLGTINPIDGTGAEMEAFFLSPEPNFNFIVSNVQLRQVTSGCTLLDASGFFDSNDAPSGGFVAYYNVSMTDRVDAAFFVQNTLPIWQIIGFAHIGCRMTGASGGLHMLNSAQNGGFNNRVSLCTWTETIRQCDLYNGLGSNQSGDNLPFTQPNARLSTGYGSETPGCHTIIGQNLVEAGGFEMNVSSYVEGNPGYNKENKNFIFHRNIFLRGSDIFNGFIGGSVTGVWARLNIGCVTPTRTSTQFAFAAAYQGAQLLYLNTQGGYASGAGNNPVKAYSNTLVSFSDYSGALATQTAGIVFIADTPPAVVISANNLLHREHGASPVSIGPLVGEVVGTPRHQGFRNYVNTTVEPRTIPATHYVDLTGVTGTYNEGTTSNIVTLTAPGTVTASIGQVVNTGGSTRRLYLYNVTGPIASGATVSVSGGNGGGSGTADGAMVATNFLRLWQTTSAPGADAGQPFAQVGFFGGLQTTAFRGALPQAV